MGIQFRLLGETAARTDQCPVDVGPARRRHILAVLLFEANAVVSIDELIDRIWEDRLPRDPKQVLYSYVSRLRQVLAPFGPEVRIVARSGGYLIEVEPMIVDVHRIRALFRQARAAEDATAAESKFAEALGMWRGAFLSGLDTFWAMGVRDLLDRERLAVEVERNDLALRRGRGAELLPALSASTRAYPLDETLAGQLMLALYQTGRQAEALEHFRGLCRRLEDEAVRPQARLHELYRQILNADTALRLGTGGDAYASNPSSEKRGPAEVDRGDVEATEFAAWPTPAQLPAEVVGFTGRGEELAELDVLLGGPQGADVVGRPAPVVISALSGAGGVGKTALALRWAHRHRGLFPDGQLYINLRGYESEHAVAPADALAGFLRALGINGREIPDQLDQRAAMFRTLLDQRRMLVVLDNAGSADQVRPLLPGGGSSAVLVTSRNRLAGLVARDGAYRIELPALPLADAVGLLQDRIGAGSAAEREVLESLAHQCMRLPLALRIAAELIGSRPGRSLRAMVNELSDPDLALEALSAGDDQDAAVRAVFMSSYRNLTQDAAHAFRCLGLYPGESFDAYAVAALTQSDLGETGRRLDTLTHAHLIQTAEAGRFRIHDLLRAFAAERCRDELDDAHRAGAATRLLDHYLSSAARAMDYAYPEESKHRPSIAAGRLPAAFADPAGARAWLDAHRSLLCTLARFASDNGFPQHLFKFAAVLSWYLHACVFYEEAGQLHANTLRVARRTSNRCEQAYAMLRLGRVRRAQQQLDESFDLQRQALQVFRVLGDRRGEAQALGGLGSVSRARGNIDEDLYYQRQTLEIAREMGDEFGQAIALENIAFDLGYLGRYDEALPHRQAADEIWCRRGAVRRHAEMLLLAADDDIHQARCLEAQRNLLRATSIVSSLNDPTAEAEASLLYRLGCEAARQGRIEDSLAQHRRAMDIHRANNNRLGICSANDGLGLAYLAGDRYREACEHFEIALAMAREWGSIIGLAGILNNLGEARTRGGDFDRGLAHHGEALELARRTGERLEQARALNGLAQAHLGAGRDHAARECRNHSLAIFDHIGARPGYGPRRQQRA